MTSGRPEDGSGAESRSLALALARARATGGLPVDVAALGDDGVVPSAVGLAVSLGAPLAPVIDGLIATERARARLDAEVRRASSEARAVAVGLVVGPPVLGIATAALVTDDPVGVLATSAGQGLLTVAGALWLVGIGLVVGAIRRATTPRPAGDGVLVLTATALRAGEPLSGALRRAGSVARATRGPPTDARAGTTDDPAPLALWLDLGARGDPPAGWDRTGQVLASAHAAGVALAPLLDQLAADRRTAAHDAALERAARLGATLAVPTALFLLPAGLLLAAGPLLLATLEQLGAG